MRFSYSLLIALQLSTKASANDADEMNRKLTTAYGTNFFIDSTHTEYNAYQTAWRFLGHIVKCGYPSDRYNEHSHSGDGEFQGNNYCQRYLMWAAYVDPNYNGGGIGEYSIYNPSKQAYSGCYGNSGRCVEMDCHETTSENWKLMGVYKEAVWYNNDAFFEQLFKHEAYCVWEDGDAYEFMSDAREKWTVGCISTGYTDEFGDPIYMDLKPAYNANMQYSLYSDDICKTEYHGSDLSVSDVAYHLGLLSSSNLEQWNGYMDTFKVCQPCKAYSLGGGRRNLGNYNNGGSFQCDDDAGYTNVNQCMKFRSHAELESATWEDLVIGTEQGGILEIKVGQTYFGTKYMESSQAQYLQALMEQKAQLASEEEAKMKRIQASLPSSGIVLAFGSTILLLGIVSLVGSVVWGVRKLEKRHKGVLSEPLILQKIAVQRVSSAASKAQTVLSKVTTAVNKQETPSTESVIPQGNPTES